jgi:hypothetical protein
MVERRDVPCSLGRAPPASPSIRPRYSQVRRSDSACACKRQKKSYPVPHPTAADDWWCRFDHAAHTQHILCIKQAVFGRAAQTAIAQRCCATKCNAAVAHASSRQRPRASSTTDNALDVFAGVFGYWTVTLTVFVLRARSILDVTISSVSTVYARCAQS